MLNLGISHLHGYNAIAESGFIKSIQAFSITIASGATTGTATVTSVSTTLSSLHLSGMSSDNTGTISGINDIAYLTQTNATTITATRNGTSGNVTVKGYIIEWDAAAVRSVQMGTITLTTTSTTNTATISSVTTTNSAVFYLGTSSSINGTAANSLCRLNLTDATTVTATRQTGTSATVIVSYCVVEWQSGVLNSNTQERTIDVDTADTISAVTTAQTMLAYGGQSLVSSGSWNGQYNVNAALTGTTTVTTDGNLTSVGKIVVTVVEFKASQITLIQRNKTECLDASKAYEDVTITSVDTTKTIISWCGQTLTTGSNAVAADNLVGGALTSATNLRLSKGRASNTVGQTYSWEAIQFNF